MNTMAIMIFKDGNQITVRRSNPDPYDHFNTWLNDSFELPKGEVLKVNIAGKDYEVK